MADAPKDRDVLATVAQVDNPSYQDNLKVRRDPDGSLWIVDAQGRKVMSGVPADQKALGATISDGGIGLSAPAGPGVTVTSGLAKERVVTAPISAENRIEAVDYYPWIEWAENKLYRFGRKTLAAGVISRIAKSDGTESNGVDVTTLKLSDNTTLITQATIISIWAWDDFQLMQVKDGPSGKCLLYKSVNNFTSVGANATYDDGAPVYAIGWDTAKTAEADQIAIMAPWSLARGKNSRGEELIVFGQYNSSGSRTPGGANDWSNVIASKRNADAGSFDVILEMNTAGSTIVRHCHAVQQDPYTGEFWIQYGDQQTSAVYVWDGIHPISPNTRASDAYKFRGWRGMDQLNNPTKNYNLGQLTSIIFTPEELICPVDHGVTAARGIYTLSRDLTKYDRIGAGPDGGQPIQHSFYSSAVCPITGTAVVSEIMEPGGTDPSADFTLWIYTATKASGYRDWKRVARYMLDTGIAYNKSFASFYFRSNGDLILGCQNGAGKDLSSMTAVCRVRGQYSEDEGEVVVHPVYWVDPVNGSDTNNGYRPSAAFKTLGYALTGSRVCTSSMVKVLSGTTSEGTVAKTFQYNIATSRPAQLNYPIIIEGVEESKAVVSGAVASWIFTQPTTNYYSLLWRKLTLKNTASGSCFATGTALTKAIKNEFRDVSLVTDGSPIRVESGTVIAHRWTADLGTFGRGINADFGTDMDVIATAGVVRGGQASVIWRGVAASNCRVENVTGIGHSVATVYATANAVNFPTVRNCVGSGSPVCNDSRTTKTSVDGIVDYNAGTAASTTLVGGAQHSIVNASLGLIGTTGMPTPTSVLIGAGLADAGPASDRVGVTFGAPKNIGAFT